MADDLDRRLNDWAAAQGSHNPSPGQSGVNASLLTASLKAALRPVKPLPPRWALAAAFLGVFLLGVAILLLGMQDDGFHLMTRWQMIPAAVIFSSAAILFALYLAARMLPGSLLRFSLGGMVLFSALGFAAVAALLFPWRFPRAFAAEGWPCAVMELEIAAGAAIAFFLLARRGAILPNAAVGAALGGISAFFALTVQQFQCMFQQAPHLLVWHGGTAAILIGAGALLGRRRIS